MKNRLSKTPIRISTAICLLFLSFCPSAFSQTPTPTPQVSPTPQQVADPRAIEFEEKFNYLRKLDGEFRKLMNSADVSERENGKLKAEEVVNLSKDLYGRLETNDGLAEKVAPTVKNAKNIFQFLLKQSEINGYGLLTGFHRDNKDWLKVIELQRLSIETTRETLSNSKFKTSRGKESLELGEVVSFGNIASIFLYILEKPDEALKAVDEGIAVVRPLQESYNDNKEIFVFYKNREADFLDTKARIYDKLNKETTAIESLRQAFAIYQSLPNHEENQVSTLTSIGSRYGDQLDYENALSTYNQALQIAEKINDRKHETNIVALIGIIYASLDNYKKANEMFHRNLKFVSSAEYIESYKNKKLPIPFPKEWLNSAKSDLSSSFTGEQLNWFQNNELAISYYGLKEYDKAIEYAKKALQTVDSFNQPSLRNIILILVAGAYREKEDWQNALTFYEAAAKISVNIADKSSYGFDLSNLANVYLKTNQLPKAEEAVLKALLIFQALGADKEGIFSAYSDTLNVLAQIYEAKGNRRLAIFYGKQAVNAIQRERQQLKNLDRQLQRGYLQKNRKPYRRLAGWLIADGRLAEAERVLQMLKEDELSEFVRRDDKVARELLAKIPPDDVEREALRKFDEIAGEIMAIGKRVEELTAKKNKYQAPDEFPQNAELKDLDAKLGASNITFRKFLDDLDKQYFPKRKRDTNNPVDIVSSTRSLLKDLKQPKTVIVSTIIEEKRLNLIVSTSTVNRAHTVDIREEELDALVVEFRQALQNPKIDPRPLGKKLYDILFPHGLKEDLAGIQADTIVWSLDGILRYVPTAALWDGEKYLVERYNQAVISLASRQNVKDTPVTGNKLEALGLGVSKESTITGLDGEPVNFPPLPAVQQELCSIVEDPKKTEFCRALNYVGVMKGRNLSDDEFTYDNFTFFLGRYPVVHIASHFSLNPGNEGTSYLLLGGKDNAERKLTLREINDRIGNKLQGTEILTLSACNTGMSGGTKAGGEEVESFAAIAQKNGAKSVLSSLWAVADPSTRDLMTEFYKQLRSDPTMGKAKAMRNAQIVLMRGRYMDGETPRLHRGAEILEVANKEQPKFNTDENAPFAHPFYWSPFILIGNWR